MMIVIAPGKNPASGRETRRTEFLTKEYPCEYGHISRFSQKSSKGRCENDIIFVWWEYFVE